MRIAYIGAGAAGMYCGSCIHDNTLAAALMAQGHDVALVPLYTPIRTDEEGVSLDRVFYGAINVYLQQRFGLFRHTPRAIDRWFDRPGLLGRVSRFAASTDARDLGSLTLSVLRGEEGRQRKELHRLLDWLESFQPEIVQLPNALLLGLAREIKRRLARPVICALTGEDLFLSELAEPSRSEVLDELRRRARDADALIATSHYYAEVMRELLGVTDDRMHVVPLGVDLDQMGARRSDSSPLDQVTIGYLARICPEKGLQILLDAFRRLTAERSRAELRLEVAGYVSVRDRPFLAEQQRRVEEWGLQDRVAFLGEVDRQQKLDFLRRIDLLSVPTTYREPKGLYVLEALAHGVPVVQPRHGAFPELIEATGGGTLVEPESAEALAEGLATLIDDAKKRQELGGRGRQAIEQRFHSLAMAERTADVYRAVLAGS